RWGRAMRSWTLEPVSRSARGSPAAAPRASPVRTTSAVPPPGVPRTHAAASSITGAAKPVGTRTGQPRRGRGAAAAEPADSPGALAATSSLPDATGEDDAATVDAAPGAASTSSPGQHRPGQPPGDRG